jgi:GT2 family glycosyltransferase
LDLSVILVNWNTRDALRDCLTSLRAALQASPMASEVCVVDNASRDGSAEMTAQEFPEVRLTANTHNRNYAAGSNQMLAAASGEFLLLLNPDTVVPVGAPDRLVAFLRSHPGAAAVAPALVHPDGRLQQSVRGFPGPRALMGEILGLACCCPSSEWGAYRPRDLPLDQPSEVDQPMTSALLIRRAALDAVGVFDEAFPLFFNDVDLCFRLRQAGWSIFYEPAVRVVHDGGASTRQVRPEAIRLSHEGLQRFYAKHYQATMPAILYAGLMLAIRASGWARVAWARRQGSRGTAGA